MSKTEIPVEETSFKELRELNAMTVEEAGNLLGVTVKTIYRWEKGEVEVKKHCFEILWNKLAHKKHNQKSKPDFTFIDLFAGIGGIRKGFEAVGGKCVFTSEWDEYAQCTYRANFHDAHRIVGDITEVDASTVPDHDVLLAGFPCLELLAVFTELRNTRMKDSNLNFRDSCS